MRALIYMIALSGIIFTGPSVFAADDVSAIPGEYLVKIKAKERTHLGPLFKSLNVDSYEMIAPQMNLFLIKASSKRSANSILEQLRARPEVAYAQRNHIVQRRAYVPNDKSFSKQWGLNDNSQGFDINAPEAWAISKGGQDALGNTVVVAAIDGGFDIKHRDLKDNHWKNTNEIAGNGIDDDGNGYVDDVNGWNGDCNCNRITSDDHGTHVAGIMGARGDNNRDVTGVNWNVKVMTIPTGFGTDKVIRAYTYVLDQKKLFISSKGRRGANVVSTNSSFGIDNAKCESGEYPAWNDMYNQLGKVGILSAVATANNNVNVDSTGDVPSACSSPYIIAVTNTTRSGKKARWAGYGKKHIDLGAPGSDILSLVPNNRTSTMSGTSMATPHVAGAIGLFHAAASLKFAQKFHSDPAKTALEMKRIILSNTTKQSDLSSKTVSGGRLNLKTVSEKLNNY